MQDKLKRCLEDILEREDEYEKILYVDAKGRDLTEKEYKRLEQLEKELEALDAEYGPLKAQEEIWKRRVNQRAANDNNTITMNDIGQSESELDFGIVQKKDFEKRTPITDFVRKRTEVKPEQDVSVWRVLAGLLGKRYDDPKDRNVKEMVASIRAVTGQANLLNDYLSAQILDAVLPKSRLIQAGMRTMPMAQGTHRFGKITSIPSLEWKEELGATTERSAVIDDVTFEAHTLRGWVQLSMEFLKDGVNAEDVIRRVLTQAVAQGIDDAGLAGSGIDPIPLGILNTPGVASFTVGNTLSSYSPFVVGQRLIHEQDGNDPSVAILSPNAYAQLADLRGTNEKQTVMPPPLVPLTYLQTSKLSSAPNTDAVMGDFSSMVLGIRTEAQIFLSPVIAETYAVKFLIAFRGDIQVIRPEDFCILENITNNDLT